jgi:hypothetical protein
MVVGAGAGIPVTTKVTFTAWGLFAALPELKVTSPLYVPGPKPAGFTATVTFAGEPPATPLGGVMESQLPPAGESTDIVVL